MPAASARRHVAAAAPRRLPGATPGISGAAAAALVAAEMWRAAARVSAESKARPLPRPDPSYWPGMAEREPRTTGVAAPVERPRRQEPGAEKEERKPSATEQRRACERLSRGRCGDPRHKALMRRLNESASWLSDVSSVSEEGEVELESQECEQPRPVQLFAPGGRCVFLAEALNESATWIDCDISDSDDDERRGAVEAGHGRPTRSYSC